MRIGVDIQGQIITKPGDDREVIIDAIDRAMEELVHLGLDATVDLDLGSRTVEFELIVEAQNPFDAVNQAHSAVRTALHAAEVSTPDWPSIEPGETWGVMVTHVSADNETEDTPDDDGYLVDA